MALDCNPRSFIKLYRKFMEWEWYWNANTKALFIHCLLKANWKSGIWRGIHYEAGELITSLPTLSEETGLSIQQVRTALKNLESTGELTSRLTDKSTGKKLSKNRIITVNNWNEYNGTNSQDNSQNNRQVNRQKGQQASQQASQQAKVKNPTGKSTGKSTGKKNPKNGMVTSVGELRNEKSTDKLTGSSAGKTPKVNRQVNKQVNSSIRNNKEIYKNIKKNIYTPPAGTPSGNDDRPPYVTESGEYDMTLDSFWEALENGEIQNGKLL